MTSRWPFMVAAGDLKTNDRATATPMVQNSEAGREWLLEETQQPAPPELEAKLAGTEKPGFLSSAYEWITEMERTRLRPSSLVEEDGKLVFRRPNPFPQAELQPNLHAVFAGAVVQAQKDGSAWVFLKLKDGEVMADVVDPYASPFKVSGD